MATDPITLAGDAIGRHAVVVNANDVAVTGVRPRWFLMTVLFPLGVTEDHVLSLFLEVQAALADVGAVLVGGHTEVSSVVTRTVVVGHMAGAAESERTISTSGARPGHALVQVGEAPIEGAAVLARCGTERLSHVDDDAVRIAAGGLDRPGISVVETALLAAQLGASCLHDPTEGGMAGALNEIADASSVSLRVDPGALLWFEPAMAVLEALGADPMATLASGTLLAAFPSELAQDAVGKLRTAGHTAAVIGSVEEGSGVVDSEGRSISRPERDELNRLVQHDAGP
jgi:hydrogenase maturation factor